MAKEERELETKSRKIYELLVEEYGEPEWRPTRSGFEQLIQTILSANTNDRNSGRAFETLKTRFGGDWDAIRTAPLEEVKDAIRVAGMYNQKAPHIVETLDILHREKGCYSLDHVREMAPAAALTYLQRFPGVGHKTASIVLLFSYGMAAFPVDTHVQRVTQRLGMSRRRASAEKIKGTWEEMLPEDTYFCLHMNLIRHGRSVCIARTPRCAVCVLNYECDYNSRAGDWVDAHPDQESRAQKKPPDTNTGGV
ncbi:MAG: endonuclease III [Caldilineaceae bacterium SB0664_bin_27]|uniref:Endonuclease III n=1 Tax=Caldilineaceae bacterium SB0664_bin_27 TaxID=2605260 RepID=A0A6B0YXN9_9CHLR|nr:endonuclease III [Caldilineaceae bacterium SB0664_bin_27]